MAPYAEQIPQIRITLESMRHTIVAALHAQYDAAKVEVERQAKAAIDHYDFAGEVRRLVNEELAAEVRRSINHAVASAFWAEPIRDLVRAAVEKEIQAHFGVSAPPR